MSKGKEVVIIGGGVAGNSVAYHLTKRGVKPLIIERDSIGARASGKAWGFGPHPAAILMLEHIEGKFYSMPVEQTGGVVPFLELYRSGWYRMPEIAMDIKETGGIDIEYCQCHWIQLAATEEDEEMLRNGAFLFKEQGHYGYDFIDAEGIQELIPGVNPKFRGGLTMPQYQVEPYKYTLGYAQTAEKRGAEIKQGEVVGFGTNGSKVKSVKLASGKEIEADVVIMAMGPWLRNGVSWLGRESDIVVAQEQCLRVEVPGGLPLRALTGREVSIAAKKNGEVIVGISGGKNIVTDMEYTPDEEEFAKLMEGAVDMLPQMENAKILEKRGDLEGWGPAPAHAKPVLGRLPEWDNAYMLGQFGTLGISQSAGSGEVMADLVTGNIQVPSPVHSMVEYLSPK
jgi:glycine oxidase